MKRTARRPGFTILELLVVLAILILLGAFAVPTIWGTRGNTYQKAGAVQLKACIADARGLALAEGTPYRMAISTDGKRIRVAPDTTDFASKPVASGRFAAAKAFEVTPENVTYSLVAEGDEDLPASEDQWNTIGTFLPNGTCREDSTLIEVHEANFPPLRIRLRGVTGTALQLPPETTNGGMK